MDPAATDEMLGELLDLTRRLRGQLSRHAALGAWAAPGGAGPQRAPVEPAPSAEDEGGLAALPESSPAEATGSEPPGEPTVAARGSTAFRGAANDAAAAAQERRGEGSVAHA